MDKLHQPELNFASDSPINTEKLGGQNKLIFNLLSSGKTINCYEAQDLGITALNSRISNLRNKHGVAVYDWFEKTAAGSHVKRYSFTPKPETDSSPVNQ